MGEGSTKVTTREALLAAMDSWLLSKEQEDVSRLDGEPSRSVSAIPIRQEPKGQETGCGAEINNAEFSRRDVDCCCSLLVHKDMTAALQVKISESIKRECNTMAAGSILGKGTMDKHLSQWRKCKRLSPKNSQSHNYKTSPRGTGRSHKKTCSKTPKRARTSTRRKSYSRKTQARNRKTCRPTTPPPVSPPGIDQDLGIDFTLEVESPTDNGRGNFFELATNFPVLRRSMLPIPTSCARN
uniref:Uncharacterized protein n=1 Tax=Branchiostoma floridae TaxID=7739 RepID=C3Y870_BRAFL|eukprot:XP_002607529.1 hypothetical protein BRAFLDRAFT_106477 [Branchiostoma floridae]